jgi:plastocyanin
MVVAACGAAAGASPAPNTTAPLAVVPTGTTGPVTISIKDFAFLPQTITIAVGTTVIWKNLDGEPHTVRGADEQVRSNALDEDEAYSVKFDKPGTYKYGCSIHPRMSGTVVVK